MNIENAKEWLLKIANGETDNKGNDKQNEVQSTEILEIPKDENGNIFDPKNLGDDQKQVFYQVMKKVKEWIEYKENDTKMKESIENEYKMKTQFQPLYLTVAGGGGSGKSVLVKTIIGVIRQIFQKNNTALVGAPTGSASFKGGGITVHRLFGVLPGRTEDNISQDALRTLKKHSKMQFFLSLTKEA